MTKSIAVVLGHDGRTASLFEQGSINVFINKGNRWELVREIPVSIDKSEGISGIREYLTETAVLLGDTKIIVGREISGLPYNVLDAAGFDIYEIDDEPGEFLDYVAESREESEAENGDGSPQFVETGIQGDYFINLKEAQNIESGLSSKQILLPFLKGTKFHELKVLCSHIPPWFETGIAKLGMKYEAARISHNEYEVVIFNRTCNE